MNLSFLLMNKNFIVSGDLKNPKDADHVVKNLGESVAEVPRITGITDGEYLFK